MFSCVKIVVNQNSARLHRQIFHKKKERKQEKKRGEIFLSVTSFFRAGFWGRRSQSQVKELSGRPGAGDTDERRRKCVLEKLSLKVKGHNRLEGRRLYSSHECAFHFRERETFFLFLLIFCCCLFVFSQIWSPDSSRPHARSPLITSQRAGMGEGGGVLMCGSSETRERTRPYLFKRKKSRSQTNK